MKRAVHWIRQDGWLWFIPHGRITLNRGSKRVEDVTCKVCLRLLAARAPGDDAKETGR